MDVVARETQPGQSAPHDATVIDARAKSASAGVWLRRTEFTTDRVWLPERPQTVRAEADPLPPEAAPGAAVTESAASDNRSTSLVPRPAANAQLPPPTTRDNERSTQGATWRSVRTGPDQFVAERYSVASAMEVRLQVVVIFAMLFGILSLLLLYILIRSLGR